MNRKAHDQYLLKLLSSQKGVATLAAQLCDFHHLQMRLALSPTELDLLLIEYQELLKDYRGPLELELQCWQQFLQTHAEIIRCGDKDWPANRILLQLAIETDNQRLITERVMTWLATGSCNWNWLRRILPAELNRSAEKDSAEISSDLNERARTNPCRQVFRGHTDQLVEVILLPDNQILSRSRDHNIRKWDIATGDCLLSINCETNFTNYFILGDGSWTSFNHSYQGIAIWDINTGRLIKKFKGYQQALPLSTDRLLLWGETEIRVIDWHSDESIALMLGHIESVNDVVILSDGSIVSYASDNTIAIWHGESYTLKRYLLGHTGNINGVIELDDRRLVSWSDDRTLRVWQRDSGECLAVLAEHHSEIYFVELLSDQRLLSRTDNMICIWDGDTYQCLIKLSGRHLKTDNSDRLVLQSEYSLQIWDLKTITLLSTLRLPETDIAELKKRDDSWDVIGVEFLADNLLLTAPGEEHNMLLWDLNSNSLVAQIDSNRYIQTLKLPDGRLLTWTHNSSDGEISLWDFHCRQWSIIAAGESRLKLHPAYINGSKLLSDNSLLTWTVDGVISKWNCETARVQFSISSNNCSDAEITLLDDNRLIRRLYPYLQDMIDPMTGNQLGVIQLDRWQFLDILPLSDNRLLFWGRYSDHLYIYDLNSQDSAATIELKDEKTGALRRNSVVNLLDKNRLLRWASLYWERENSWNFPYELQLWDLNTGKLMATIPAFDDQLIDPILLPDNRMLTVSDNGYLGIWDLNEFVLIDTLYDQESLMIGALLISADRLITWAGAVDPSLYLWDLATPKLLARIDLRINGPANGIIDLKILSTEHLISRSPDNSISLWDRNSLECLKTVSYAEASREHPEWLIAITGEGAIVDNMIAWRVGNTINLSIRSTKSGDEVKLLRWHSDSAIEFRHLLKDGTIVAATGNGELIFLSFKR